MKTHTELIKSAERELAMRHRVYPKRVERRAMTQEAADHEIACQEQTVEFLKGGLAGGTPVVASCENIPGGMGPDYAVLRLRNGVVLTVGDEGVNVFKDEAALHSGEPSQGLTFSVVS